MCDCNKTSLCGCKPKCTGCAVFIDSSCVNNVDVDLGCSGILKGQTLSEVLVQLDAFICDKFGSISNFSTLINIGTGTPIFKQTNVLGQKELKTLLGSNLITITPGTNEITLSVNETALNTFIESNQKTYSAQSTGSGTAVYSGNTITGDNTRFTFKSLTSDSIVITENGSEINIEIPADENIIQFYVNEDYSGDSTGTILKPFKTYVDALINVIGTGTIASPQYINAQIVLQSNVSVNQSQLTANTILENKISVNTLGVVSDNTIKKTIFFSGTTDYPIDTEFLVSKVGFDGSSKLNSNVRMSYSNIILINSGSKGIVRHRNYFGSSLYTTQNTSSLLIDNCQIESAYITGTYVLAKDSLGNNIKSFGVDVLVQDNIANNTPHVYSYDMNFDAEGGLIMTDTSITATNQTAFKISNTTFSTNDISIGWNSFYNNTSNKSVTNGIYLPKTNIYSLDILNSYVRLESFKDPSQRPYNTTDTRLVGGSDALFNVVATGSPLKNYFEITEGYVFTQQINYVLKTTSGTSLGLLNCNFSNLFSVIQAFLLVGSGSASVYVQGSNINQVIDPATSNVTVGANSANINGFQFTSQASYTNDAAAITAGLITGNIYYNTTIGAMKKI